MLKGRQGQSSSASEAPSVPLQRRSHWGHIAAGAGDLGVAREGMAAAGAQAVAARAEVCAEAAQCTGMNHAQQAAFCAWGSMLICQPAQHLDATITPPLVVVGCSMLAYLLEGSPPGKRSMPTCVCTSKLCMSRHTCAFPALCLGQGRRSHCVLILNLCHSLFKQAHVLPHRRTRRARLDTHPMGKWTPGISCLQMWRGAVIQCCWHAQSLEWEAVHEMRAGVHGQNQT